jgi:Flp pilus assembly protein TadG
MIALAAMKTTSRLSRRLRHAGHSFIGDRRAVAAIEFAFIFPLALVLFFGTLDASTGLAASRKVTLTASALADLTSEMPANGNIAPIADSDLQNMFTAAISIMNPYLQNSSPPFTAQISEIYTDSSNNTKILWSRAATVAPGASQASFVTSTHGPGDTYVLPPALQLQKTYVILIEVRYSFVPVMSPSQTPLNLNDNAFSRPREATCLVYNGVPAVVNGKCPLT